VYVRGNSLKVNNPLYFSSTEMKKLLKNSDCELMHLRTSGKLKYQRSGNAFLYSLPNEMSLLSHPLGKQLLDWHLNKHPGTLSNIPSADSQLYLEMLIAEILIPTERKFDALTVTYGFTSSKLAAYIAKHSSSGTAPQLDQHAVCELNSKNNEISKRTGSACDFIVPNQSMAEITRFIVKNLNFDRIYYYGNNRPIHVSISDTPIKHLQIMCESSSGRRYPGTKAFGDNAILLAESL
jgi:hypothetical protein